MSQVQTVQPSTNRIRDVEPTVGKRKWKPLGIKALIWDFLTMPFVGVVYMEVIAKSLANLNLDFANKLYKVPLLGELQFWHGLRDLTLGHVLALIIMLVVWRGWIFVFQVYLNGSSWMRRCPWNVEVLIKFITPVIIVLLICELYLFYYSIAASAWGSGDSFSFPSMMITIMWGCITVVLSFISFSLENPYE